MTRAGPEATLMLLSAGTAGRREQARELAAELARRADWDLLGTTLSARDLLPQLGPRIVELAGGRAPDRFSAAVRRSVCQTRRQGALLVLVAERLMRSLADAGVPSLVLKGASLGEKVYGDPGCRPAGDIDLLLASEDLPAAVELVRRAGYQMPSDRVGTDGLPLLHHALRHAAGALPPVELHWRIHWYERRFAADMLMRSVEDARGVRRPRPVDELASLLLFYARDGFLDLRLATDIGAWWDAYGAAVPAAALTELLDRYPALEGALAAAVMVAERIVGIPGARVIGSPQKLGGRARLAVRMADPNPSASAAQLSADASLVDWLLAPHGQGIAFMHRQLLVARGPDEFSRSAGRRRMSSVRRLGRVLARLALRMTRLLAASARRRAAYVPMTSPRCSS